MIGGLVPRMVALLPHLPTHTIAAFSPRPVLLSGFVPAEFARSHMSVIENVPGVIIA